MVKFRQPEILEPVAKHRSTRSSMPWHSGQKMPGPCIVARNLAIVNAVHPPRRPAASALALIPCSLAPSLPASLTPPSFLRCFAAARSGSRDDVRGPGRNSQPAARRRFSRACSSRMHFGFEHTVHVGSVHQYQQPLRQAFFRALRSAGRALAGVVIAQPPGRAGFLAPIAAISLK